MSRAEGTEAKGDGVTEEGKSPSSEGRCAPVGATIMRGNYHIQPYLLSIKQSVTARNQYQNRQTGKSTHMYYFSCLPTRARRPAAQPAKNQVGRRAQA